MQDLAGLEREKSLIDVNYPFEQRDSQKLIASKMMKLYEKKIPVVFIGKAGSNRYPQYVTYYLLISDKENLRDRISQFSSHIALQYMLDVLFGCIYNKNRTGNMEYLHESIGFMDDREIDS